ATVLLAQGALVGARNRRGAEPLHYAADGGPYLPTWDSSAQGATVTRLIEAGANPNALDKGGVAPLHRAGRCPCAAALPAPDRRRGPERGEQGGVGAARVGHADDGARWERVTRGSAGAGGDRPPAARAVGRAMRQSGASPLTGWRRRAHRLRTGQRHSRTGV